LRPIQKGETRNPYGVRHTKYIEVRRLCADHSVEAALELITLIADTDSRVRYMACMAVLERGVGKPRDHSGEEDMTAGIDLNLLTREERDTLAGLLRRVFGIEQL
jgi:hypothetical protein